jgi:hypothetical protein
LVENNCCTKVCGLNKNDQKYYQTFVFFVAFRIFCDIIFFLTRQISSLYTDFIIELRVCKILLPENTEFM